METHQRLEEVHVSHVPRLVPEHANPQHPAECFADLPFILRLNPLQDGRDVSPFESHFGGKNHGAVERVAVCAC